VAHVHGYRARARGEVARRSLTVARAGRPARMRSIHVIAIAIALGIALACHAQAAPREVLVGGPCEGCELVFEGRPARLTASARIAPASEPGDPLVIDGVVRDLANRPVPGVIVYAYQTNARGVYLDASARLRHGRLRASLAPTSAARIASTRSAPGRIRIAPSPSTCISTSSSPAGVTTTSTTSCSPTIPGSRQRRARRTSAGAAARAPRRRPATRPGRGTCAGTSRSAPAFTTTTAVADAARSRSHGRPARTLTSTLPSEAALAAGAGVRRPATGSTPPPNQARGSTWLGLGIGPRSSRRRARYAAPT
jgi:hypothetical protein